MKKKNLVLVLLLVFTLSLFGCSIPSKETVSNEPAATGVEVNISAAASLTDALKEIQAEYSKNSKDVILFNFAGSGTLRKQILEGAPCDLFFSASKSDMDALEEAGLLAADSRLDLLGNTLTLVGTTEIGKALAEKEDAVSILSSNEIKSVSIGTPESVPAGKYAKKSLESLQLWEQLQSKLVLAKDVRQVLEYVETGNVEVGLVYKTDAMLLKTGMVLGDMPEGSYGPIIYPMALIKESSQADAARTFYDFLKTDYAKEVFEKYGFTVKL